MFTPIHRALGIEPGAITHHLIDAAVDRRVEETGDLDWKTALYDSRKPTWQDEVAKDVAAMANSGGGWIVFGVEEDGEANGASKVTPVEWNAAAQQRILRAAYARVGPPVLGLEFFPLDVEEGHVVLLRVPDSRDAPHFARKGDDAFVAPRRNGPHTVFMSDREIERSFRERFQRLDDREHQLQALFKQAGQGLNPEQGVVIVMAALPAESGSGLAPMSEEEAHKFFRQPLLPSLVFPGGQSLRRWESTRVRKGMRHNGCYAARRMTGARFGRLSTMTGPSSLPTGWEHSPTARRLRPTIPWGSRTTAWRQTSSPRLSTSFPCYEHTQRNVNPTLATECGSDLSAGTPSPSS